MDCPQQAAATIMSRGRAKGHGGSTSSKATRTASRSVPVPSTSQDEPQVVEQLLPTGIHQSRLRSGNLAYAATDEVAPPLSVDGVQTLKDQISKLSSELDTLKKRQAQISAGPSNASTATLTTASNSTTAYPNQRAVATTAEVTDSILYAATSDMGAGSSTSSTPHTSILPRVSNAVIPPFRSNEDDFETWHLRLEAIASTYHWDEEVKRSLVLSQMRGEAATYVFKEISEVQRSNYKLLIEALDDRYTEIESRKTYRIRWRKIRQEPEETEQELAARVKSIYDKAFPGRNEKVRQEDLVNAFLEALRDDRQREALEYPNVPQTIKEATVQAVHYREAVRKIRVDHSIVDEYEYERETETAAIRRVVGDAPTETPRAKQTATAEVSKEMVSISLAELQKLMTASRQNQSGTQRDQDVSAGTSGSRYKQNVVCDHCHKVGHKAERCWKRSG